jgi:hypothetical protein
VNQLGLPAFDTGSSEWADADTGLQSPANSLASERLHVSRRVTH